MSEKVKWGKGVFSNELANIDLKEAIGKTILCEDGLWRRCVTLTHSMKWPWKMIINEEDPDSNLGHFVSTLSLCAQILNKPLPDKDAIDAFEKVMRVKFNINADGSFDQPPQRRASQIFTPRRDIN